uniref:G_PROTEIN_RECEP_F1_2 domain-containing protein n=1 Tax=Heterorhabditis bacteriophora TaxID=37862 RepID=A0A1I7WN42_HETBA
MVLFESLQIVHSYWWEDPCDVFIPVNICIYVRVPLHACLICFVLLQFGLCIERTIATVWSQIYEKTHCYIGLIVVSVAGTISILCSSYIDIDLSAEPQVSCLNNSKSTWIRIDVMNYTLTVTNIITFLWTSVLHMKNRTYIKRLNVSLTNRYQLHENMMSLKLIVSLGVVQFTFYAIFLTMSIIRRSIVDTFDIVTYRIIASFGYTISYYTLALPILVTSLVTFNRRQREKTIKIAMTMTGHEGRDNYFKQYRKQW